MPCSPRGAALVLAIPAALALGSPGLVRAAPVPAPQGQAKVVLEGYALALPVARAEISLNLGPAGYGILASYRTSGILGAIASGAQTATVSGRWRGEGASPGLLRSDGSYHGAPHHTAVDFAATPPATRVLEPAEDGREPVPASRTAGSIDPFSMLALAIHRLQQTGRCDLSALVFDGRRLGRVTMRDRGEETLPSSGRSNFAGPAHRCEMEGQLLAGFKRGETTREQQPKHGTVWFAPTGGAGEPPMPVRGLFDTPWVGQVAMYAVAK